MVTVTGTQLSVATSFRLVGICIGPDGTVPASGPSDINSGSITFDGVTCYYSAFLELCEVVK